MDYLNWQGILILHPVQDTFQNLSRTPWNHFYTINRQCFGPGDNAIHHLQGRNAAIRSRRFVFILEQEKEFQRETVCLYLNIFLRCAKAKAQTILV